jgi:ribonuclease BN (tRNA processing enzyme)
LRSIPRRWHGSQVVSVQFLGTGDAFGSGGRFQTCLRLAHETGSLLIDCGASSLVAIKRHAVAPGSIDAIVLSHLHGDHFGGVPFFILDAQFSRRSSPLVIGGPPGVKPRMLQAMDVLFPGSSGSRKPFAIEVVELGRATKEVAGASITALPVVHTPGANAHGIRVELTGRIIAYSGDTEWTDALVDLAAGADLFICEAYFFEKRVPYHLDYRTLIARRAELRCKRMVLTHMSEDMLAHRTQVAAEGAELAEDGMVIEL